MPFVRLMQVADEERRLAKVLQGLEKLTALRESMQSALLQTEQKVVEAQEAAAAVGSAASAPSASGGGSREAAAAELAQLKARYAEEMHAAGALDGHPHR